jgi:hypothetical protein
MLLQVARDFAVLPDLRTITAHEIAFFYDALRPELKKHTRGKTDPTPTKRTTKPKKHARR